MQDFKEDSNIYKLPELTSEIKKMTRQNLEFATIPRMVQGDDGEFKPSNELIYILQTIDFGPNGSEPRRTFYCFVQAAKIGQGTYGSVYKAYPVIDIDSGEVHLNNFVVAKAIHKDHFKVKEYKVAKNYIAMYKPISYGDDYILIQKYLGEPLDEHPLVPELPPKMLGSLIEDLAFKYYEMHHLTRYTKTVTAHCDTKPGNILINFNLDAKSIIDINIVDFGLALNLDTLSADPEDAKQVYKHSIVGNDYFPPEARTSDPKFGLSTDIYQLAGVIAYLFGFDQKSKGLAIFQTQYSRKDLLKLDQFNLGEDVNQIVVDFLNRMRHSDYLQRPNSDETLKFFNLFNQFNKYTNNPQTMEKTLVQNTKDSIQMEMSNLAEGCWHKDFDMNQFGFGQQVDKIVNDFNQRIRQAETKDSSRGERPKPVSEEDRLRFFELLAQVPKVTQPPESLLKELTSIAYGSSRPSLSVWGRLFKPNTQESKKTPKPLTSTEQSQQLAKSIQSEANLIEKELKQNSKFFYITVSSRAFERLDSYLKNLSDPKIYSNLTEACFRLANYQNERIICVKYPKNKIPTHAQIQKENILWASGKSNDFTDLRTNQSQTNTSRLH